MVLERYLRPSPAEEVSGTFVMSSDAILFGVSGLKWDDLPKEKAHERVANFKAEQKALAYANLRPFVFFWCINRCL